MSIEYLGLSEINGPLIALEGVQNASYEEIVEITVDGNKKELGRIIECYKDKAVIQVLGGTPGMLPARTNSIGRKKIRGCREVLFFHTRIRFDG